MKLLHVDTSILGGRSVSRELTALIVERLTAGAQSDITYRDLTAEAVPHLTAVSLPSKHPGSAMAGRLDAASQAIRDESDRMLEEFLAADVVVAGAPMYNFTVPSQLKAWIDRLIVPGTTFKPGPNGVEGLAKGKRVIVAVARGGFYGPGTATLPAEHAETLLRTAFGFMGITPEFVLAEGMNFGPDAKAKAVASAREAVGKLAA